METTLEATLNNDVLDLSYVDSHKEITSLDTSIGSNAQSERQGPPIDIGSPACKFDTDEKAKSNISEICSGLTDTGKPTAFTRFNCVFFHLFFKAAMIVSYLIVGMFLSQMTTFIIVTVCAVLDFWIVKNVTGRMLVGLRWWTTIDDSGKEKWFFESYDFEFTEGHEKSSNIFWPAQMFTTCYWSFILLMKIITFTLLWGC